MISAANKKQERINRPQAVLLLEENIFSQGRSGYKIRSCLYFLRFSYYSRELVVNSINLW